MIKSNITWNSKPKHECTKTNGKHEGLNTQTNDKTRDTCEQRTDH